MKQTVKPTKKLLFSAIIGATMISSSSHAANWLMLQGTEKPHQAPSAKLWGFIQAEYIQTDDTKLKGGPFAGKSAAFNQIAPQLDSASSFNIRRARIGVRGNNFQLDPKVNYFILAEFGNNGITTGGKASKGQITDASITLNHIPGARVRAGLFKTPGSEEGLQAATVFNYINFTNVTNRILLERFYENATGNSGRSAPVGAFRDTGIQVFDSFRQGDWEHTYALMYGNGYGVEMTDNDSHKDLYLYASTEKIFNQSKGPRRHGVKLYAWMQKGKRSIGVDDGSGAFTEQTFDRKRSGIGTTYFDGKYRLAAEYITADGMIYGGPTGGGLPDDGASFRMFTDEKAKGYYLDLGYRILPNLELNVRYDMLDSGTETAVNHREYITTTLGAQYFLNKKTALRFNYELRDIKAPDLPATHPAQAIVDSIDDRISAQVHVTF